MREIVKQEVDRSVVAYERKIGAPRHAENQKLIIRIGFGITILKAMGGTALVFCAIFTAYVAYHHH